MRLFLPPSIALTRRNCKAPASDPPFSIVNCPFSILNHGSSILSIAPQAGLC